MHTGWYPLYYYYGNDEAFQTIPLANEIVEGMESLVARLQAADPEGNILKDVTLPRGNYTELWLYGDVAVSPDGSLYAMSSTKRGIEIHYLKAP